MNKNWKIVISIIIAASVILVLVSFSRKSEAPTQEGVGQPVLEQKIVTTPKATTATTTNAVDKGNVAGSPLYDTTVEEGVPQ